MRLLYTTLKVYTKYRMASEIPDSRYYSVEEPVFWQMIVWLILPGYRVQ